MGSHDAHRRRDHLLVLAVSLVSLGVYFWTAPRVEPTVTRPVEGDLSPASLRPNGEKASEANTPAELERADAAEKAAAERAAAEKAAAEKAAAEKAAVEMVAAAKAAAAKAAADRAAADRAAAEKAAARAKPAAAKPPAEAAQMEAEREDASARRQAEVERAAAEARRDAKAAKSEAARQAAEMEAIRRAKARADAERQDELDRIKAAASRQATVPEPDPFAESKRAAEEDNATFKRHYVPETKDLAQIVENRKRIEQLPKGDIVLDGPSAMKVSETRAVHANVGVNVPIETLRGGLRPGSQVDEGKLAVSSEMIAVLSGPGFKITATTPEQQSVAEGYPTVWSWDVEAKSAGDQELEASLYLVTPRQRIASYKHRISGSVMEQTWGEWVKSFRDEIDAIKGIVVTLSGVVTGVVGWLVLYSDRRKKKEAQSVPS
jgi:hypothetical protein